MNQEELAERFQKAVQQFWNTRETQQQRQQGTGRLDAGTRGAVTGGAQMNALEELVVDLMLEAGLDENDIHRRTALELPGYYRPEKKWDLLAVSQGHLVVAIEFKSQVGPSFGNNFNNRVEEAVGSATDVWTAYREGRFGQEFHPLLAYFFLLEDCAEVHTPVSLREPYFAVDPIFKDASYSQRYAILCQRLKLERRYDATCLTLATNEVTTRITYPGPDLSFPSFATQVQGHVRTFVQSRSQQTHFDRDE